MDNNKPARVRKLGAGLDEEEKGVGWLSGQNKQRGETRMKQYIFAAWLMVCVGCGGESLPSGPNPLETFDQDRLYVLIHAAVNRGGRRIVPAISKRRTPRRAILMRYL